MNNEYDYSQEEDWKGCHETLADHLDQADLDANN